MKQSVTVGAQLLWGGRYGCNNGRYGCTIVMSYIEINKAVSQWLLTFNLCVSVTWPLTCAFHIPCTHTPEIIDMHRGVCDKWPNDVLCWICASLHNPRDLRNPSTRNVGSVTATTLFVLLLNSRCPKHHKMLYGTELSKSLLTNIIFTIYICYRNIWKFFIVTICPSQCKHLVRHNRKWLITMRR